MAVFRGTVFPFKPGVFDPRSFVATAGKTLTLRRFSGCNTVSL